VSLRYVARAGLLPELSRQTYDSFPKAMREAVLDAAQFGRIGIGSPPLLQYAEAALSRRNGPISPLLTRARSKLPGGTSARRTGERGAPEMAGTAEELLYDSPADGRRTLTWGRAVPWLRCWSWTPLHGCSRFQGG
jgi:hypothetical protein